MQNNSIANRIALVSTIVVIALALGLFASGNGFTDLRLAVAFALQVALAIALVFHIFRYAKAGAPASGEPRQQGNATRREATEVVSTGDAPDQSTEIITDTAGELRTSVEVMQEELEEILDEDVPADKEHMESLYQETDRLRKIIDGMEQLAEAQALARTLKKEPVQVGPLLKEIVERTQSAHPERKIAYSVECDPGLAMTGDAACISRIIGNIADNAAKSVKGTGSVVLAASREGDETVFSVRDTGTGIRRAQLPHLYERFFRGTGSGVGMGLAIAKELVDACGGKIAVESAMGKGTTFTVRLPG